MVKRTPSVKSKTGKGHQAGTTKDYTPGDIQHVALSDSSKMYDHPARMKPDPQGGGYWGDSNGLGTVPGE